MCIWYRYIHIYVRIDYDILIFICQDFCLRVSPLRLGCPQQVDSAEIFYLKHNTHFIYLFNILIGIYILYYMHVGIHLHIYDNIRVIQVLRRTLFSIRITALKTAHWRFADTQTSGFNTLK